MTRTFVVMLRQPRRSDLGEMRTDPFWEFGSFGLTGCHGRNLLHPRNWSELAGSRLAFAQGGPNSVRLLALTPPVEVVVHPSGSVELRWSPSTMPFRFEDAPRLVDNFGDGDAPCLEATLRTVNRTTMCGAFGSRFRSRSHPLPDHIAEEIRSLALLHRPLADSYLDALPYPPRIRDSNREETYRLFLEQVGSSATNRKRHPCSSAAKRSAGSANFCSRKARAKC